MAGATIAEATGEHGIVHCHVSGKNIKFDVTDAADIYAESSTTLRNDASNRAMALPTKDCTC